MESDFNCVEVDAIDEESKLNENVLKDNAETKEDVSVLDLTVHCEPTLIEEDEDMIEDDYNDSIGLVEECVDPLEFLEVDQISNTGSNEDGDNEYSDYTTLPQDEANLNYVSDSNNTFTHQESVYNSEASEDSQISEYQVNLTENSEDTCNNHLISKPRRPRMDLPVCEDCGYLKKGMKSSLEEANYGTDLKNDELQVFCDCASDTVNCKICNKAVLYSNYSIHLRHHKNPKQYVCNKCGRVFQHPIQLRNHTITHHPGQDINCNICKRSFKLLKSLRHHQASCKKYYKCIHCSEIFPLKRLLVDHLKTHEKKVVEETFSCEICCIVFDSSRSKKDHIMEVHVAAQRFVCGTCGEAFVTECAMRRHTKNHNRSYPCKSCDSVFGTRKDLLAHRLEHRSLKDLRCRNCDKEFEHLTDFSEHKLAPCCVKRSVCDLCKKAFKDKNSLKKHVLTHTPLSERSVMCDICKRNFSGNSALKKHIRLIHTDFRPYTCEFCSKSFNQLCKLKYHIVTHSSDKPVSCEICNKAFGNDKDIKIHMRTHTGERPFQCNLCGKTFRQRGHVKTHQIVHTKERPFNCQLCDKRFGLPSSLKKHMKLHASRILISGR